MAERPGQAPELIVNPQAHFDAIEERVQTSEDISVREIDQALAELDALDKVPNLDYALVFRVDELRQSLEAVKQRKAAGEPTTPVVAKDDDESDTDAVELIAADEPTADEEEPVPVSPDVPPPPRPPTTPPPPAPPGPPEDDSDREDDEDDEIKQWRKYYNETLAAVYSLIDYLDDPTQTFTPEEIRDLTKQQRQLQRDFINVRDIIPDGLNNAQQRARTQQINTLRDQIKELSTAITRRSRGGSAVRTTNFEAIEGREREQVKQQVLIAMREMGLPRRLEIDPETGEKENLTKYLGRLHVALMGTFRGTIYNEDSENNAEPYATPQTVDPMAGPALPMKILDHIQSYKPITRVKTVGAFLDQMVVYLEPDNHDESQEIKDFKSRHKRLAQQISVWHNRAVVRRNNYDAAGPDGVFKTLNTVFTNKMAPKFEDMFSIRAGEKERTPEERATLKAMEFCMGVWAARTLKSHEKRRLLPYMSESVKKFLDRPAEEYGLGEDEKPFDVSPPYRGDVERRLTMIEAMVAEAEKIIQDAEGIPEADRDLPENRRENAARVAYHMAEAFRISSGIESELDREYTTKTIEPGSEDDPNRLENLARIRRGERVAPIVRRLAKVQAQEGEPKGQSIGLYVESAGTTEARPDFNKVFGNYLVHGWPTYARGYQVTHGFYIDVRQPDGTIRREDLSGYGDSRSSLAEILSVDGAIDTVDWSTHSTDVDRMMFAAANQVVTAIWPRAQVSSSLEPKNQYFLDPKNIHLETTQMLNRQDELERLRIKFESLGVGLKNFQALAEQFQLIGKHTLEDLETIGFVSHSAPLSGDRLQHIKNLYKNFRDYWLSAFTYDQKKYPYDVVRLMRYMFSRDDRDETNGFVNEKIQHIVEGWKDGKDGLGKTVYGVYNERGKLRKIVRIGDAIEADEVPMLRRLEPQDWVSTILMPQITGYISYDVLMRSVFYLLKPDFRNADLHHPLKTEADFAYAYRTINYRDYEEYEVSTKAGGKLVNVAELQTVINQAVLLRKAFKEEVANIYRSGYRLFGENPNHEIFDRNDLLRMAKEFDLGGGYQYVKVVDRDRAFAQLQRTYDEGITAQYLSDRIILLLQLFHRQSLGGGKH